MPEYGREYWETHQVDRRLSLEQLEDIAVGHLEREEAHLAQANRYLFTDTNALTTYRFSLYYHGNATPYLAELANRCLYPLRPGVSVRGRYSLRRHLGSIGGGQPSGFSKANCQRLASAAHSLLSGEGRPAEPDP